MEYYFLAVKASIYYLVLVESPKKFNYVVIISKLLVTSSEVSWGF